MANDHERDEFARTAAAATAAVSGTLAQLEAVLAAQRRGIVALAAAGGVELPSLTGVSGDVSKDMAVGTCPGGLEGDSTGLAAAMVRHTAAHAICLALYNAVAAQQQLNVLAQAVTAQVAARALAGRK
ncbi:RebB family R body protein [Nannocystis sp. SCPEA4]|uniref:RebB family R body protein n=1 Tax=Nannocystis sp. SCPEA4 TaxID=2996787 RepID=UPI002271CAB2|nr:RebB family R body protein [Nannocystis sp. SCPEA4]MCY1057315.1 RebB family R body protein [Nannocystis sp. SCPEA4]